MSEQEAKTKWCPFARGCMDNGGNRMAYGGPSVEPDAPDCHSQYAADMADLYPCIGSACMAFRWLPVPYRKRVSHYADQPARTEPPRPADVPASWRWVPYDESEEVYIAHWIEPEAEADARREGFCGLAGKP